MATLKKGDKVKLRGDVLLRHARSVPAHAGYTKAQFAWRKLLGRLKGKVGTVERVFSSGHTNVRFRDATLIGIEGKELVKSSRAKKR